MTGMDFVRIAFADFGGAMPHLMVALFGLGIFTIGSVMTLLFVSFWNWMSEK